MPAKPSSSALNAQGLPRAPETWSRFRYPQSLYKYGALLAGLALIAFSLEYLKIPLDRLPGMLGRMGEMLGRRYFPPNVEHVLREEYLTSVIETLQSQAPAEIQSDVQTMAAGLLDMIAIFDQYDYDLAKVSASPEFQELNTRMNSQEVATAGDNLNTYESEVCGITES